MSNSQYPLTASTADLNYLQVLCRLMSFIDDLEEEDLDEIYDTYIGDDPEAGEGGMVTPDYDPLGS